MVRFTELNGTFRVNLVTNGFDPVVFDWVISTLYHDDLTIRTERKHIKFHGLLHRQEYPRTIGKQLWT